MTKLEKKYGKYAIRDLTLMLLMCYGVGYVIQFINSDFLNYLSLNPYEILHGQIWRLLTWVVVPFNSFGITTIIYFVFCYSIGTTLEQTWGAWRYNVYIFSGLLFTIIGSFVSMLVLYLISPEFFKYEAFIKDVFTDCSVLFNMVYINLSILLAFSATFPDTPILLMFVIPIKVKWLGIMDAVLILIDFIQGVGYANKPYLDIFLRIAIISSLLNFILFFIRNKLSRRKSNIEYFKRHYK